MTEAEYQSNTQAQANTIVGLRATLAVEIAERNRYKRLADKLHALLRNLRQPVAVAARN